jgi:hypothetical protein
MARGAWGRRGQAEQEAFCPPSPDGEFPPEDIYSKEKELGCGNLASGFRHNKLRFTLTEGSLSHS